MQFIFPGAALHQKFLNMNWDDQSAKTDFYTKLDNSTVYHQCVNNISGKMSVSVTRKPLFGPGPGPSETWLYSQSRWIEA